ncbi:G-type lectin S-receptor-like serine/threonine-protein kinase SD1-13 isoform X5 [Gossypium raimondii]|uniref:G-type lectin S-receptor-like serine/threonine-protein kinase SD1-13 isoform X5 n=1 Tax=Gossypium raimondii TaxID=29730 RepID=UPI00227AE588|nr:G-type lectin S-receptor-like serine/threonine-protein kinase SD1-13 isoform X5 [Gossypium raimondii]
MKNCSCVAYAYDAGIGCMLWSGDLIDVQKFSNRGVDLYIRLPSSELDKGNSEIIVITTVISGMIVIIIIFALFLLRRMGQQRGVESLKSGSIDERGDKETPKPSFGPHKLREGKRINHYRENKLSGFHDQCFSGFTLNEQETSQQFIGIEQSKFRIK